MIEEWTTAGAWSKIVQRVHVVRLNIGCMIEEWTAGAQLKIKQRAHGALLYALVARGMCMMQRKLMTALVLCDHQFYLC